MDTPVATLTPDQEKVAKEIGSIRKWLNLIERDLNNGAVIHAQLLLSVSESCAKLIYSAGMVNADLLRDSK